jgi:hypothetical protein
MILVMATDVEILNDQTCYLGSIINDISDISSVPLTANNRAANVKCNYNITGIIINIGEKIAYLETFILAICINMLAFEGIL